MIGEGDPRGIILENRTDSVTRYQCDMANQGTKGSTIEVSCAIRGCPCCKWHRETL
jgi:hypothetical protein